MQDMVIFADYGIDDAAATVSIFNHSDRFDRITLIPIGGNVPTEVSYRNCYTLLSHFPQLWEKVTVVTTCHLEQPYEYLVDVHGRDGMGDFFTHPQQKPPVREQRFEEWLNGVSGNEIVLSLGPMTLVRALLQRHTVGKLVIMGGLIKEEPNFNGYEFNHALDTAAFSFCVKFPHVAVTLDTCRTERLNMRNVTIEGDDLHSRILRASQRFTLSHGESGCYVWDDVAACYILFPERYEVKPEADPFGNLLSHAHYISEKRYYED